MPQTENCNQVFLPGDATNSQSSPYFSVWPLEVVFRSELNTMFAMFVFVKFSNGWFQRVSCNGKHGYLTLMKDFFPFQSWYLIVSIPDLCTLTYFKNHLVSEKKNQFVKML